MHESCARNLNFLRAVPFNEGTAQGIKCLRRSLLQRGMYMVDYCVIQFSKQQIVAAGIDRELRAGCGDPLSERFVPCLDGFDAGGRQPLQTISQVNSGSDNVKVVQAAAVCS